MNEDEEFQLAVDTEIQNIARGDLDWIEKLEPFTNHAFSYNGKQYEGSLIYYPAGMSQEYHSVVLKLERKLMVGYRSYLAGFSFNDQKVFPILSELLYSCD